MKVRLIWPLVLALALVVALAGCSGSGTTAEKPAATAEQPAAGEPAPTSEEPAAAAAPVAVGEPVTSGDWTLTAKEVERDDSAGGIDAPSGSEMLIIKFDLKNGTAADQGTGPVYFTLTDASGASMDPAQTSGEEFIFNTPQPIKAGETREIKIAYIVPTGSGPFTWTFTPFVEGGAATPGVVTIK